MQLSFENIETIVRSLDMHKAALRRLMQMGFNDAVAVASFSGYDTEGAEEEDPAEFKRQLLMQISDIDKVREALREITGI